MATKFKVGQKLKCLEGSGSIGLIAGKYYTVAACFDNLTLWPGDIDRVTDTYTYINYKPKHKMHVFFNQTMLLIKELSYPYFVNSSRFAGEHRS